MLGQKYKQARVNEIVNKLKITRDSLNHSISDEALIVYVTKRVEAFEKACIRAKEKAYGDVTFAQLDNALNLFNATKNGNRESRRIARVEANRVAREKASELKKQARIEERKKAALAKKQTNQVNKPSSDLLGLGALTEEKSD